MAEPDACEAWAVAHASRRPRSVAAPPAVVPPHESSAVHLERSASAVVACEFPSTAVYPCVDLTPGSAVAAAH